MNKEWSELNKLMQTQIKKKDTYDSGKNSMRYHISTLRVIIARPLRIRCGISFVSRISWLTHNQRG